MALPRPRTEASGWIESPGFDLVFLVFAPLVTLPIMAAIYLQIPALVIIGGLTLGFAHYSSTLSFYFWDENRDYLRKRWLAFYAGPIIILAAYLLVIGFHVPHVIQLGIFFWNTYHVARQNCGILSIYRHRAGVADPKQRDAANSAILSISLFMALTNFATHSSLSHLFARVSPTFGRLCWFGAGALALFCVVQLAVSLRQRIIAGQPLGLAEMLFLGSSLVFFYPYLFMRSSEMATLVMLLPHYVQYMTLVWLLHRRKFGQSTEGAPSFLLRISKSTQRLIPALLAAGLVFYGLRQLTYQTNHYIYFEALYLFVAFEHFYLDGLFWSFKQPHVRQTIGPFLLRRAA